MNRFMNTKKAIQIGNQFWDVTMDAGLGNIATENMGDGWHRDTVNGKAFVNMSSYSYLGLDSHPVIVKAAADAILANKSLNTSISRIRIHFNILKDAEQALGNLFNAEILTTVSCAAAANASLPLIASGAFTKKIPPLMVFDKNAHFCLNMMKPVCADESEVTTINHNDLSKLEDLCKSNRPIAYVADGVYSTGGKAPVKELLDLQDKYGLFLFFDEAHSLSTLGKKGQGLVLEEMGELNDKTLIITSLNKGFGASGGAIFLSKKKASSRRKLVTRFGGPITWSQRINVAGLGGILASTDIHLSEEIDCLQQKLQENISLFDEHVPTSYEGDGLPIRFIPFGSEEDTIAAARKLLNEGFYTSPLFFPIIARGKAGLRIMVRANMKPQEIEKFGGIIKEVKNYE